MSFKKTIMAVAAVGALTAATAVPAMALENEFHGMYKFMGYQSNFWNGAGAGLMENNARSGFFAEQRARLMYIAKANDNLKLVTHFELDSRFGGKQVNTPTALAPLGNGYDGTYTGNDAGNLDADQLTLETKNIYLDFNCPITGANVKIGGQPWADAYNSLFLLGDITGVYATKKFDPATVSLGWFRFDDNTTNATASVTAAGANAGPRQRTGDLIVLDGKYAVSKDIKVGASYYNVQNDTTTTTPGYEILHAIGVNADLNFGPANVKPFAMYQFGEQSGANDISAYMFGAVAKVKAGPGAVNLSAFYLSGDDNGTGDNDDFKVVAAGSTYFNPANMWLLIRSGQAVNSSFSVLGNDLGVNGRGSLGLFAGYEGSAGKVFYNANLGYMATAEDRGTQDGAIGTEINAQVGYKMFDNMSVSAAAAYAILGDGLSGSATDIITGRGVVNADDPYMINVQVSYVF